MTAVHVGGHPNREAYLCAQPAVQILLTRRASHARHACSSLPIPIATHICYSTAVTAALCCSGGGDHLRRLPRWAAAAAAALAAAAGQARILCGLGSPPPRWAGPAASLPPTRSRPASTAPRRGGGKTPPLIRISGAPAATARSARGRQPPAGGSGGSAAAAWRHSRPPLPLTELPFRVCMFASVHICHHRPYRSRSTAAENFGCDLGGWVDGQSR